MRTLYVMQGVPGSGKSTMAEMIAERHDRSRDKGTPLASILSTDDFWCGDSPGTYVWDASRLTEAHQWNQQRCIREMQDGIECIIIDNTNIQKWQAEPYFTLARIFGYEIQVVSVQVPLSVAIKRQQNRQADRRVSETKIREMAENLEVLL